MYNDTVFGASTTVILIVLMMFIGLNDYAKVVENKAIAVHQHEKWMDVDTNHLNMSKVDFNLAFGFPGEVLDESLGHFFVNAVTKEEGKPRIVKPINFKLCEACSDEWADHQDVYRGTL